MSYEEPKAEPSKEDEKEKKAMLEQIEKVTKEHVLQNINGTLSRISAKPEWGGEMIVENEFGEILLTELLIEQNPIIESQDVLSKINELVIAEMPVGEELNEDKKEELAEKILEIIHNSAEVE